jgi:hypothetical protein
MLGGGDELLGQTAVRDHDQTDHWKNSRLKRATVSQLALMVMTRLLLGQ